MGVTCCCERDDRRMQEDRKSRTRCDEASGHSSSTTTMVALPMKADAPVVQSVPPPPPSSFNTSLSQNHMRSRPLLPRLVTFDETARRRSSTSTSSNSTMLRVESDDAGSRSSSKVDDPRLFLDSSMATTSTLRSASDTDAAQTSLVLPEDVVQRHLHAILNGGVNDSQASVESPATSNNTSDDVAQQQQVQRDCREPISVFVGTTTSDEAGEVGVSGGGGGDEYSPPLSLASQAIL